MSTPHPSTPDRELTLGDAAAAIHEAVPALDGRDVRLLGTGWDFDAYEADGRWVFRFPRRVEEQERLRAELALLPHVADRVPVPIPRYAWGELRAASFPYVFSGYAKLEGVNASRVDPAAVDRDALGRSLGAFYRALHAVEVPDDVATAAGVNEPRLVPGALRDHLRKYLPPFQEKAAPALAARAVRFFDDGDIVPAAYQGPPRLLHDDVHAEHLLLDPGGGGIAGILDWSDMVRGDPARDLGYLYSWGGDPLLDAMLEAYGPADARFASRVRFHGTCVAFLDWDCYVRDGNALCEGAALRTLDAALP